MDALEEAVLQTVAALPGVPVSLTPVLETRLAQPPPGCESQTHRLRGLVVLSGQCVRPRFDGWITNFRSVAWHGIASPSTTDLEWAVKWIGNAIFAECALTLPEATSEPSGGTEILPHLAFLAKLVARDSNLGRAHLFTLNYDTLFEQALELLQIQYFDGFTGRTDARFDPPSTDSTFIIRGK